jgi:hypothetical protein
MGRRLTRKFNLLFRLRSKEQKTKLWRRYPRKP